MLVEVNDVADQAFDYVIVGMCLVCRIPPSTDKLMLGGGTAGLVVAARLSEDPSVTVCVLESGPANLNDPTICTYSEPDQTRIAALIFSIAVRTGVFGHNLANPAYDWGHISVSKMADDRDDDSILYRVCKRTFSVLCPCHGQSSMAVDATHSLKLYGSGRGLGGSSGLNFMVWQRPPAEELDG